MPRPRRLHGRPGTGVIPGDWETSHAPIAEKTRTARCRIWAPTVAPKINDDLTYDEPTDDVEPAYDGTCRVQVLNARDTSRVIGDEQQYIAGYLVALDRDAEVGHGYLVDVYEASDPLLTAVAQRLFVRMADMGTLRFERDIYCTDQL